jgi:undecaprenyl-diphosphatase
VLGLIRRRPFESEGSRLGWNLILATIPAGLLGLALKDRVEAAFGSLTGTAVFLLVTAVLLLAAEIAGRRNRCFEQIGWKDALVMGLFQAISIFPGVSRSGSTMTGGMMRSLDRQSAARFSFLMSIPIMLAAGLLATRDMLDIPNLGSLMPVFIPGFLTAAVVGYAAIRWLLGYLTRHPLYVFAIYCAVVGLAVLGLSLIGA